jgi:peptidyl-prolyl cis-trans isomerase SurA
MRKFILFVACVLLSASLIAQTVFTYGNKAVSKQEFIRAFNKSPEQNANHQEALKEYLPLYINYKLKVQAGYDEQLDKNNSFQLEASNFKNQITENFINEEANEKKFITEAVERSKKDIAVQEVFVGFEKDTAAAYKKIQAAYQELKNGKTFDAVVEKFSTDDETKKSKGNIGFITVFTLPYEIENIIYGLAINQFSAPYKSRSGYHIFKNVQQRPAAGKRKVEQILLSFPPNSKEKN